MKARTLLNSIKESLKNIIRHPLITVASISTVALMLGLLGAFTVISLNANHMVREIAKKPAVSVYVSPTSTEEDRKLIESFINSYPGMIETQKLTPWENYDQLVKELGDDAKSLQGYNPDLLPYTYNVRFEEPSMAPGFRSKIEAYRGVEDVNHEANLMNKLNQLIRMMNVASLVAFGVMCVVTLFIISNMVRISVFSRAEEINIMKYIGATNVYIRLPYILEGALTGVFGALLAWGLIRFGYNNLYARLLQTAGGNVMGIAENRLLLPMSQVSAIVLLLSLGVGILIGSLGSALSVRKYIRV